MKINNNSVSFLFYPIFVLIIGIAVTLISAEFIPFYSDEYIQYSGLGCMLHPNNNFLSKLVYYDGCEYYKLALLKDFIPRSPFLSLASFGYVGNIGSIFLYPLLLIWHGLYTVRLLGLLMLGVQAFILEKLFKVNKFYLFIFLLLFQPYASQHLIDLGQLSYQTTSVFLFYYVLKRSFVVRSGLKRFFIPCLIGFLLAFGMWIRLSYNVITN